MPQTVRVIQKALKACGLPRQRVQAMDNPDRLLVNEMLRGWISTRYADVRAAAQACINRAASIHHSGDYRRDWRVPYFLSIAAQTSPRAEDYCQRQKPSARAPVTRWKPCWCIRTRGERFCLAALSKQMAESGVTLHGMKTVMQVLHGPAKSGAAETERAG